MMKFLSWNCEKTKEWNSDEHVVLSWCGFMKILTSYIMAGFLMWLKAFFTKFSDYLKDNFVIEMELFPVSSVCIGFISNQ